MADDYRRTIALLQCWAEWRRVSRRVVGSYGVPDPNPPSLLGILIKRSTQQGGEIWKHNEPPRHSVYDDELMNQVTRLIAGLPVDERDAVHMTYIRGRHRTADERAKKLGMGLRTYYRRLESAHKTIDAAIDWRNVLVV